MNPCPCGFYGDTHKPSTCAHARVTKYQKRISGPLLDRIDIYIEVPRVDDERLSGDRIGESSEGSRAGVQAGGDIQSKRFRAKSGDPSTGSGQRFAFRYRLQRRHARGRDPAVLQVTGRRSKPDASGDIVLCMTQLNLSARTYHRTRSVKLARTIADLAGCEEIQFVHLAEALHASQPAEVDVELILGQKGAFYPLAVSCLYPSHSPLIPGA